MHVGLVGKRSRLPAVHSSRDHGHMVDAAYFSRHVPADFFETRASKQLHLSRDMFDAREPVVVLERSFSERCASDTQPRALGKSSQDEIEVLTVERNVSVEIADDLVIEVAHP